MLTADSSIGEYLAMYLKDSTWQVHRYIHEQQAADKAWALSKEHVGARVYVLQVTREFFSTSEVIELKAK